MKFNKTFQDSLFVMGYKPKNPKAIIQIHHGISEHIGRYNDFMSFLADNDFYVFGADCRGHGKMAGPVENLGYGYGRARAEDLLNDIKILKDDTRKNFPNIPYFHLGHSMGSFQLRAFMAEYPEDISGIILTGTGENSLGLIKFALALAKVIKKIKGPNHKSKLLKFLTLDSLNSSIKKPKTGFDWLSYNEDNVKNYIEDPYCGFELSVEGYETLFNLIKRISKASIYRDMIFNYEKIISHSPLSYTESEPAAKGHDFSDQPQVNSRKSFGQINNHPSRLPILLLSGQDDPVGKSGKDIVKIAKLYKKNGMDKVSYKLYPKMRHEILNETNKIEVYKDILNFINSVVDAR